MINKKKRKKNHVLNQEIKFLRKKIENILDLEVVKDLQDHPVKDHHHYKKFKLIVLKLFKLR